MASPPLCYNRRMSNNEHNEFTCEKAELDGFNIYFTECFDGGGPGLREMTYIIIHRVEIVDRKLLSTAWDDDLGSFSESDLLDWANSKEEEESDFFGLVSPLD